jgi:hypothetical protein
MARMRISSARSEDGTRSARRHKPPGSEIVSTSSTEEMSVKGVEVSKIRVFVVLAFLRG